jgi:uncharacterized ubiquitin-like protein YukD
MMKCYIAIDKFVDVVGEVELGVEVDVEEMIKTTNRALSMMLNNQLKDCQMRRQLIATLAQNENLLKMMKTEPY